MGKLVGFPEKPETAFLRGNWHCYRGEYEKAVELYDWALTLKPYLEEAWNNKGNALDDLGKLDEAIKAYDEALKIKPDYYEAWNNKGAILAELGETKKAVECYRKAAELDQGYVSAFTNLAEALLVLGETSEGAVKAKRALELAHEARDKAISLFLCISAHMLAEDDKQTREYVDELINILKEAKESFKVTKWNFARAVYGFLRLGAKVMSVVSQEFPFFSGDTVHVDVACLSVREKSVSEATFF